MKKHLYILIVFIINSSNAQNACTINNVPISLEIIQPSDSILCPNHPIGYSLSGISEDSITSISWLPSESSNDTYLVNTLGEIILNLTVQSDSITCNLSDTIEIANIHLASAAPTFSLSSNTICEGEEVILYNESTSFQPNAQFYYELDSNVILDHEIGQDISYVYSNINTTNLSDITIYIIDSTNCTIKGESQSITIIPLPEPFIEGLDVQYCIDGDKDLLVLDSDSTQLDIINGISNFIIYQQDTIINDTVAISWNYYLNPNDTISNLHLQVSSFNELGCPDTMNYFTSINPLPLIHCNLS